MSLGKWMGVFLCWLGCGIAARAQLGVYGLYQGTSLTGIRCLSSTGICSNVNDMTPYATGDNKVNPSGGFGGVYYNFRNLGPMRFGFDARAGELHSNKSAVISAGGKNITSVQSYLGGVRGTFHTPISWILPYAEILAGFARSDAAVPAGGLSTSVPTPRVFDSYVQYEGLVGADIRIAPFLDLRAIELGIGEMNEVGSSNGASTTSMGMRSIGAGVVLHIP